MTAAAGLNRQPVCGWVFEARESLRAHAGLAALVLAYVLTAFLVSSAFGDAGQISLWLYGPLFTRFTILIGVALLTPRMIYIMVVVRPERLTKAIVQDLRSNSLARKRLLNAIPIVVLLSIFSSTFTSLKNMIPLLHPYNWDIDLTASDLALHFGALPWRLLQPILGFPIVTGAINVVYNLWFTVLIVCWLWQAFSDRDLMLRMQFFTSFVLCFALLGNLVATWLASAGPCYYGNLVTGPDPYQPLMQYLRQADDRVPLVWSIAVQDMLWKSYTSGSLGLGSGISAMPSMHVAGATLFALLGCRVNRWLGMTLSAYAMIILIGSVHLGWHYAVDGYVAFLCTLAIWWMVGAHLKRLASTPAAVARELSPISPL